ncbi:uncharacterized protein LOC114056516 [Empidonax traillii]|uniref:uncharacterized protein LOC114056516 n=1 Tax=Empidonax traillii TaxID=164674 RepID=UPI000FFD98E3|nr:uncharacterized protein LOC114056516 [Empidonax traillii]
MELPVIEAETFHEDFTETTGHPAQPGSAPACPTSRPRGQGLGPGRKLPRKFLRRRRVRGCGTPPRRGGGARPGAGGRGLVPPSPPPSRPPLPRGGGAGTRPGPHLPLLGVAGGRRRGGGREGSGVPPAPPGAAATRGGKRGGGEGRRDEEREEGAERSGACGEPEPRCGRRRRRRWRRRRRLSAPTAVLSGGHRGPSSAQSFPPCGPGWACRACRPGQRFHARTGGRGEEPGGPRGAGLAAAVPPPRRCAPRQHDGGVRGRQPGLSLPRRSAEGGRPFPALSPRAGGEAGSRGPSAGYIPGELLLPPCRAGQLGEPLSAEELKQRDFGSGAF